MKKKIFIILSIVVVLGLGLFFGIGAATGLFNKSASLEYKLGSDGSYYIVTGIGTVTSDNIVIPESHKNKPVKEIGSSAFSHCRGLISITIPDTVTSIGSYAFYECIDLKSITIGNSVTSIGDFAIYGCSGLKGVYISDIAAWCNIEFGDWGLSNPLYYAHNLYLNNVLVTDLVIPNTVTAIKKCAFDGATCLQSITIPDSVTTIGSSAFSRCSGLTSVAIPDSVTTIGSYAFYGCSGLTSITIGNSVTSIGSGAFEYCSGLTRIDFNGTKAQWNAISKGTNWQSNTGSFTVYCTD